MNEPPQDVAPKSRVSKIRTIAWVLFAGGVLLIYAVFVIASIEDVYQLLRCPGLYPIGSEEFPLNEIWSYGSPTRFLLSAFLELALSIGFGLVSIRCVRRRRFWRLTLLLVLFPISLLLTIFPAMILYDVIGEIDLSAFHSDAPGCPPRPWSSTPHQPAVNTSSAASRSGG